MTLNCINNIEMFMICYSFDSFAVYAEYLKI